LGISVDPEVAIHVVCGNEEDVEFFGGMEGTEYKKGKKNGKRSHRDDAKVQVQETCKAPTFQEDYRRFIGYIKEVDIQPIMKFLIHYRLSFFSFKRE